MAQYNGEFDYEVEDLGWRFVAFTVSQDIDAEANAGPIVVTITKVYDDTGDVVQPDVFDRLMSEHGEELRELALDTMQAQEELRQERIASNGH